MANKPYQYSHFRKITLFLLISSLLLLIVYGGVSLYVANVFTKPYSNAIDKPASVISANYKDIAFTTSDNVHLKGWIFPGVSNKAVILVHGLGQNRLNNSYGGVEIAKELHEAGYTVLVFDLRGHGDSEKVRIGYGYLENRDIVAAVKVLTDKNFLEQRIGIIGDSLGAITVLHAAPEIPGVGALIIDSSTADMKSLLSDRMVIDKHIPRFFHPGIFFMAEHVFGISMGDSMPISSVDATPERTYLFLHGEKDDYIPLENSRLLLSKANMFSKLVIFKNAGHVQTYKSDPQHYREAVFSFLEQQLGK